MKKIYLLFFLCTYIFSIHVTNVCAETWTDPWKEGAGFVDPWAQEQTKKENKKPSQSTRPKITEQAPNMSDVPNMPNIMPQNPTQQPPINMPGFVPPNKHRPAQRPEYRPEQIFPSNNSMYEGKTLEQTTAEQESPTVYPIVLNDSMTKAVNTLKNLGLTYMGECGQGVLYVEDQANFCTGIVLNGKKSVTGIATFLSKKCVEADPLLYGLAYDILSKNSKEYSEGWEKISGSGASVQQCLRAGNNIIQEDAMPNFLSLFHRSMDTDIIDFHIKNRGGKILKEFENGRKYVLYDNIVWYEFCKYTKKPISFSIEITKRNQNINNLIKNMNLRREKILSEHVEIQTIFNKGEPQKIEMHFIKNEQYCKLNIS